MSDEYRLTEQGAGTMIGVISSICHGYNLEQTAALNGLEEADEVKVLLWFLLAEANIVPPPGIEED